MVDPITHLGKDDFWNKNLSAFVEDSWKAMPNLTITAGVRYDTQLVPQPPRPLHHQRQWRGQSAWAYRHERDQHQLQDDSAAHRLRLSIYPTTVLRGGYGMFYGLIPLSAYYNVPCRERGFPSAVQPGAESGVYPAGAPTDLNVLATPPGPAAGCSVHGRADTDGDRNTCEPIPESARPRSRTTPSHIRTRPISRWNSSWAKARP